MKIFIDAGHNDAGGDTGATGHGLREQDVTFAIASSLRDLLTGAGHEAAMSRSRQTDNVGTTLSESLHGRAAMANEWGADLFVSIHCNAFSSAAANGTETLVYAKGSTAAAIAERIQAAVTECLGTTDRGVKARPDLAVLRLTSMPAVLVETAFITHAGDSTLLKEKPEAFAQAIYKGITGREAYDIKEDVKEEADMEQTVMQLPAEVYVQEMAPAAFRLFVCDCKKRSVPAGRYFNAGYFSAGADVVVPIGNLAAGGEIITQAKDNPGWINVAGKQLTTVYTTADSCGIVKTDRLDNIPGLQNAVSGIPVIVGGRFIPMEEIQAEGYSGEEAYDTWHGFLGIRHDKLVYVAMKCGFSQMCWAMVALGIYDAIKLDGGGSFILHDGKELQGTAENRRIHNVGVWI